MTAVELINLVFNSLPKKSKVQLLRIDQDSIRVLIQGRVFRISNDLFVEEVEGSFLVSGESAQQLMRILKRKL